MFPCLLQSLNPVNCDHLLALTFVQLLFSLFLFLLSTGRRLEIVYLVIRCQNLSFKPLGGRGRQISQLEDISALQRFKDRYLKNKFFFGDLIMLRGMI